MATGLRAPVVRAYDITDFNGGLNLRRDQFQLGQGESPDLLNVDIDPRGGFRLRGGTTPVNATALAVDPGVLGQFFTSAGTTQIIATYVNGAASRHYYSTGGNFTQFSGDYTATVPAYFAAMNDFLYVVRYTDVPATPCVRWSGAAAVNIGVVNYHDDYAVAAGGTFPAPKYICAHAGFMFVGFEAAAPSRVRWSHPGKPEDWRSFDYFDVGVDDGDYVTGLASYRDTLLVFKQRSVWAVTGYSANSFAVRKIFDWGAVDQRAIVVGDDGVYWFNQNNGVYRYNGRSVDWLFERLKPALEDGTIPQAYTNLVRVGYGNRRVWVGVPYGTSATARNRTFVYDSSVGKEGAWTLYDLAAGPFVEWAPPSASKTFMGVIVGALRAIKLDQFSSGVSTALDNFGGSNLQITSYYVTRWIDLGKPAYVKRWKRPQIVSKGGATGTITVAAYKDYDYNNLVRTFTVANVTSGAWGTVVWGSFTYTGSSPYDEIDKGGGLGRGKAISLKFTGPTTQMVNWGIDAITLKFLLKVLR